ncbi:MAG TPA: hypothetical protein VK781_03775, partial [Solirubrobacteraceae bacterium]|nr:hypothetical protein [Solirubrobacteraceae bacterium]
FLTIDPLLQSTGEPYTYTSDDPENKSDPTGACASSCSDLWDEWQSWLDWAKINREAANEATKKSNEYLDKIDESHWYYGWHNSWYLAEAKHFARVADELIEKAKEADQNATEKGQEWWDAGCFTHIA